MLSKSEDKNTTKGTSLRLDKMVGVGADTVAFCGTRSNRVSPYIRPLEMTGNSPSHSTDLFNGDFIHDPQRTLASNRWYDKGISDHHSFPRNPPISCSVWMLLIYSFKKENEEATLELIFQKKEIVIQRIKQCHSWKFGHLHAKIF